MNKNIFGKLACKYMKISGITFKLLAIMRKMSVNTQLEGIPDFSIPVFLQDVRLYTTECYVLCTMYMSTQRSMPFK